MNEVDTHNEVGITVYIDVFKNQDRYMEEIKPIFRGIPRDVELEKAAVDIGRCIGMIWLDEFAAVSKARGGCKDKLFIGPLPPTLPELVAISTDFKRNVNIWKARLTDAKFWQKMARGNCVESIDIDGNKNATSPSDVHPSTLKLVADFTLTPNTQISNSTRCETNL